jgi:class 3 adenylate cyclase
MSSGAELPRGTVTFLFTDVEGSTRLLKQLRDQYGEVLEAQQRVLRQAFADHSGREIDTQGDSFFVAFPRAKDAVAAAVQAQHALADESWPEGAEVRVRMGPHTGEPTVGGEGTRGSASIARHASPPPAMAARCSSRRRRGSCYVMTRFRTFRCATSVSTS